MMDVFGRKNTKLEICEQLRRSIAHQAELEDRDLIKHIVDGLNDTSGITASLYFCDSLDQLRRLSVYHCQILRSW